MTVKEFVEKMGETVKTSAKHIYELIENANMKSLCKVGVILGVSVATVIAIFKFLKDKRKMYKDTSNKSVVDEALEMNFSDIRHQQALNPLMKKVKKNLNKELKPRTKKNLNKKVRKHQREYEDFLASMEKKKKKEELFSDLNSFRREMRAEDMEDQNYYTDGLLRSVWVNS